MIRRRKVPRQPQKAQSQHSLLHTKIARMVQLTTVHHLCRQLVPRLQSQGTKHHSSLWCHVTLIYNESSECVSINQAGGIAGEWMQILFQCISATAVFVCLVFFFSFMSRLCQLNSLSDAPVCSVHGKTIQDLVTAYVQLFIVRFLML